MLAVGIDISKSKSVAAILNQDGSMHTSPFEFHHTQPELDAFIKYILNSNQSATILMENTGHYHYPVIFSNGDISPQNTFKTGINAP